MSYSQVFLSNMGFPAFQGKDSHVKKIYTLYTVQAVLCVKSIKYINVVRKEKKELRGLKIYLTFTRIKSAKN